MKKDVNIKLRKNLFFITLLALRPLDPRENNETEEGRAKNRRVELVKME